MTEEKRKIRGVEVMFPCKPYPSQFSFMDKVIQGLEKKQNCLLESPTGSGKSLALLCSALAWQTAEYEKRRQEEADQAVLGHKECTCKQRVSVKDEIDFVEETEPTSCQAFPDSPVSISVIKGQIAHQEVDVVVNTTSQRLQLNYGAVSQSLLCVGGSQLQKECNLKYPQGIEAGEVAITSAGNLKCQAVYHGALPHWREPNSVQVLQTFMRACLTTASESSYSSVSFPALGTGSLGYPKEVVVREMFASLEQFARNNPQSSIVDVRFVVYGGDGETVKSFENKLKEKSKQNQLQQKLKNAGTPSKESATIVIPESDDDDDDFKPATKFRTPGQTDRKHQNISYDEPGTSKLDEEPGTSKLCDEPGTSGLNDSSEYCCQCGNGATPPRKVPKIYFGTRTHKQVAQIVRELKKTAYKEARMTILASKEFTCIHPAVSKSKNKNEGCKELMDGPGCKFNDKVKKVFPHYSNLQEYGLSEAWDLEDFVYLCKSKKACPYFSVRSFRKEADIVFCPYNYLIDPIIRQNMEINLKNDIIILDEAHNIEDAAREGASEHFTDDQLEKTKNQIHEMIVHEIKPVEHVRLKQMVEGFIKLIQDNVDQLEQKDFEQAAKVWSGYDIVARMKEYGIGPEHVDHIMKCFVAVCEEINERQVKNVRGQTVKLSSGSLSTIERMFKTMDFLYRENLKFTEDYRVAILKSRTYVTDTMTDDTWMTSRNKRGGQRTVPKNVITLHFWCMNPGVAFSDLHNTRCIVLTSGTLSPLNSFESELGTSFPIKLEANHVIEDKQVWVGAMSQGPTGKALHAVYKNMETLDFQDELGRTVLKVCQEVPHGVLCFLPSYRSLDKFTDRWQKSGIYAQIARKKRIIMEPRRAGKEDFDELLKIFYDAVHGVNNEDDEESEETTGALFLAVCRGKVSEGLDFADNFARAVITVGIPYPNWKDLQVAEKRMYNDKYRTSRGLLSGGEWYEIQAFRALNQALGRCIRHRKDWGLLILADERFVKQKDKYCKGLSKWVRNKVQAFTNCSRAMDSISNFTKRRMIDMPVINPDTSFIPGTPVTPGQGLSRANVSMATPMTPVTPLRSNTSPPNQDVSAGTPVTAQTKGFLSKVPQPQFFTPKQNRTSHTMIQRQDIMSHILMSPTEVKKSSALTSAAQAGTVIQEQPGRQNPLVLPNQQHSVGQGHVKGQTGQGQDVLTAATYQYILSVMNSPLVPKDKPYYIIIDENTPKQHMFLIKPNQGNNTGQNIESEQTTTQMSTVSTPSSNFTNGQTSKAQSMEKPKVKGKGTLNTLFKYCKVPERASKDIINGAEIGREETIPCPKTPNLFDTQDSEQEFKVDSNTLHKGFKADKMEVDMDSSVSESVNKSLKIELNDDQLESNNHNHDHDQTESFSDAKSVEKSHNTRTVKKPIFRRHSVAPAVITIHDDSEDACDFKDQSKTRRKSCDKKILSEIHQNLKEKVDDTKNTVENVENKSDEENESEAILRTRRKSRGAKRKSRSNVRHAAKKSKGVEFLDTDGETNGVEKVVRCKNCGATLLSQREDFEKRKRYPSFIKLLTSQRFAEVIFLHKLDHTSCGIQKVTTKVKEESDIILDSHIDPSTGSVIQYLSCGSCTKDIVGIQVLIKGDKSKDIEDNQVWIVSSLVDISQS